MKRKAPDQETMSEADWRWLVGHTQGRRILRELLMSGGLVAPVASDNALRAAFLEGRRSMACEAYARLTHAIASLGVPALLAEVLSLPDVRRERSSKPDDDDGADDGDTFAG